MIKSSEKFSKECILNVTQLLDSSGVKWWIDHGTLLGIIRDGNFIEWDSDIDLGAICQDEYGINKLKKELEKKYRYVSFNPLTNAISIRFFDEINNQYWTIDIVFYNISGEMAVKYYADTIKTKGRILGRMLTVLCGDLAPVSNNKIINLFLVIINCAYKISPDLISMRAANFISNLTPKRKNEIDAFFFEKIEKKTTRYGELCCPVQAEKYLERRYGPDWMTPRRDWNFLLDDPCINLEK